MLQQVPHQLFVYPGVLFPQQILQTTNFHFHFSIAFFSQFNVCFCIHQPNLCGMQFRLRVFFTYFHVLYFLTHHFQYVFGLEQQCIGLFAVAVATLIGPVVVVRFLLVFVALLFCTVAFVL